MYHQGYALKCFIRDTDVKVNDVASKLAIARQTIEALYGKELLENRYVEKLTNAGYEIPGVTTKAAGSNISNLSEPSAIIMENQYLKQTIEAQKITIEALKETIYALKRS